jgi:hypothetical protein
MKRYFLFAGMQYYPFGGWGDFRGVFVSVEDAKKKILELNWDLVDWWQIVDSETLEVVESRVDQFS